MISSIGSSRIFAQQATPTFQGSSSDLGGDASGSSAASIAALFLTEQPDDSDDDYTYGYEPELSSALSSVSQAGQQDDAGDDGDINDISSKAFRTALAEKIAALGDGVDTSMMAQSMQDAFSAGRLTVTDASAGTTVTFGSDAATDEVANVATAEWSAFLKDTLLRDSHGLYVRNGDSSHVDKASGASAYFGLIGDNHYYLTWTAG